MPGEPDDGECQHQEHAVDHRAQNVHAAQYGGSGGPKAWVSLILAGSGDIRLGRPQRCSVSRSARTHLRRAPLTLETSADPAVLKARARPGTRAANLSKLISAYLTIKAERNDVPEDSKWKTYEEVATYLLGQITEVLGLEKVEGKQTLVGNRSGTTWEIDGKGVKNNEGGFVIIECRRYSKQKQKQEQVAALAYRIMDTGAQGGIIVSPLGIQEGGTKIANSENIQTVTLDENSTTTDYVLKFLNQIFAGVSLKAEGTLTATATVIKKSKA